MGIGDWLRSKISSSEAIKDKPKVSRKTKARAEVFENQPKGFEGQPPRYELQDTNKMLSLIMSNMTYLMKGHDELVKDLQLDNKNLNREVKDLLKELAALKAFKGPQRSEVREAAIPSNSAVGKLLKALKTKPLSYDEIQELLQLQSKSGAYSYVSTAISQGHPVGKLREGRSRRVIRTDVTYRSEDNKS